LLKVSEEKGAYHVNRSVQPAAPETEPEIGFGAIALQAVAQVRNMYILAEHPTGMWLIEQHIAHERILYEEICDRWQLVPLEPPIVLDCLTPAQVEQLRRLGLEVDPFGEQLWAVRNAPALLQPRDDCADALLELSLGGDLQSAQVATACRSAIRNGTPLSLPEMQALLDRWQKTRNPRTCPHGRPIYLSLEESALARFFRRHWVIGKSHGI
jgi:DNA mismatch repair protein MutL